MKTFTLLKSALVLAIALFASSNIMAQVILQEGFAKFAAGEPNANANSTEIKNLDDFTTLPGWTGSKVYQAGGTAKMGTSSTLGYIITPTIDLSDADATYTLTFKSCAWGSSKEAKTMKVYVDDAVVFTAENLNNTDYTFSSYSTTIRGTATSKIKFEGEKAANGRFFLDDVVVTKTQGGEPIPPSILVPQSIAFSTVQPESTTTKDISISASNLTGDLTYSTSGEGFATTPMTGTISKADAEAGTTITVTFAPTAEKDYAGTFTISGGGLTETSTINLTGKSISLSGKGTKENPYTVADLIKLNNTSSETAWVQGYIVGEPVFVAQDAMPTLANVAPFTVKTALCIADNENETDMNKISTVQLSTGLRPELNLGDNEDNFGKIIKIKGNLSEYFHNMCGVRSTTEYEFVDASGLISNFFNALRVFAANGEIHISGIEKDEKVEVYDMSGRGIVKTTVKNLRSGVISGLKTKSLYLVKVGNQVRKVSLY